MSDASRLAESIEKAIDKKVKSALSGGPKTVTAHVHGVDGEGVVWVILPGSSQAIPVKRSTVEVSEGDAVTVEVGNGRACITGSTTAPAISAKRAAELMVPIAEATHEAQRGAEEALSMASVAKAGADTAQGMAASATASAGAAAAAASAAQGSADAAADAANSAIADAATAKSSADSALVQLATVEDVVGTATWIAEHGTYEPTEDAAVDDSKVYYERTGSGTQADPYVYTAVAEPTDEGLSGYYELHVKQAVSQYVASHLALTDAGLYVLKDASGYKLLLANTGMSVIDPQGHVVVTYGSSIGFDSTRPFSIGNQDAYVLFTPATQSEEAKVVIGGNVVLGESRTLSELMAEVDAPQYDHDYTLSGGVYLFTARMYKNGVDTAPSFPPAFFWWRLRNESGESDLGTGLTKAVAAASAGYHGTVVGGVHDSLSCGVATDGGDVLADHDGNVLEAFVVWEV